MKSQYLIKLVSLLLLVSCKANSSNYSNEKYSAFSQKEYSSLKYYPDGTYCADVKYRNPNTGTSSNYTLTVDVKKNKIVVLHWPNGGSLDQDHFVAAEIDKNGYASFRNNKGYVYEVQITGPVVDCFKNVPMVQQCRGITKSGTRCKHMTDNSNGLCWQHQNQ